MLALMFVVFVVLLVVGLDLWYAMGMASLLYLVGLAFFGAIPIPLTLIVNRGSWSGPSRRSSV